jgi:hypothetical protein
VDAKSEPFGVLSIELSVGRRAGKILGQNLQFAISDALILELKSRHDGAGDPPITLRVGLEICIRHRTNKEAQFEQTEYRPSVQFRQKGNRLIHDTALRSN